VADSIVGTRPPALSDNRQRAWDASGRAGVFAGKFARCRAAAGVARRVPTGGAGPHAAAPRVDRLRPLCDSPLWIHGNVLGYDGKHTVPNTQPHYHPILVVEDNAHVRGALVDLLDVVGLETVAASNGIQALRALEEGLQPALIVLDLELPFMSGWTLCARLREHAEFSSIPVLVVSGHDIHQRQAPGVRAVLHKPVRPAELLAAVGACFKADRPPTRHARRTAGP
jgi:CheY-like chemotaxis protein